MSKNLVINLLLSFIAGAAIWALSPIIVGAAEPWDAESFYYVLSLFGVGIALGGSRPRGIWVHYVGVFAGQLGYALVFLPLGPLLALGVGFLALCSLLTLAGAAGGTVMRGAIGRMFNPEGAR